MSKKSKQTMLSNLKDQMVRKIYDVKYSIISGKIGIEYENNVYTLQGDQENGFSVSTSIMDNFGVSIPAIAFYQLTDKIKVKDLVIDKDGTTMFVIANNNRKLTVLTPSGEEKTITPSNNQLLGGAGMLTVIDLFSSVNNDTNPNGFNPLMLMALMNSDNDEDISQILPFMMMSGAFGDTKPTMNPMLMMILMDNDDSKMSSLLPLMMMGGMEFNK